MDWCQKLYFLAFLIVAAAAAFICGIHGYAMVSGTVFYDQCKDGRNVAMVCPDNNGQMTTWGEETTNWLGNFITKFDGTPDLSGCVAQVTSRSEEGTTVCWTGGLGKSTRLMFRMVDMEMYTIDPLILNLQIQCLSVQKMLPHCGKWHRITGRVHPMIINPM